MAAPQDPNSPYNNPRAMLQRNLEDTGNRRGYVEGAAEYLVQPRVVPVMLARLEANDVARKALESGQSLSIIGTDVLHLRCSVEEMEDTLLRNRMKELEALKPTLSKEEYAQARVAVRTADEQAMEEYRADFEQRYGKVTIEQKIFTKKVKITDEDGVERRVKTYVNSFLLVSLTPVTPTTETAPDAKSELPPSMKRPGLNIVYPADFVPSAGALPPLKRNLEDKSVKWREEKSIEWAGSSEIELRDPPTFNGSMLPLGVYPGAIFLLEFMTPRIERDKQSPQWKYLDPTKNRLSYTYEEEDLGVIQPFVSQAVHDMKRASALTSRTREQEWDDMKARWAAFEDRHGQVSLEIAAESNAVRVHIRPQPAKPLSRAELEELFPDGFFSGGGNTVIHSAPNKPAANAELPAAQQPAPELTRA